MFLAGTNNVSKNERLGMKLAMKNKLSEMRSNKVIVFSVPHRHDLPEWSIVNKEIKAVNLS